MSNATSIVIPSGSTQGKAVKIAATSTPGTTIHTTGVSATTLDRLYMFAVNSDTVDRNLTIEFGGTTSPDNLIQVFPVPFKQGLVLVVDGLPLIGNGGSGLTVGAFASATNVIMVYAYILRVVP